MSWKPEGYTSLAPYLLVQDPEAVAAFCVDVFNAETLRQEPGSAGGTHIELRIDDTILMLGGPVEAGDAMIHLYCPDPDAVLQRARAAGAILLDPLRDRPDGDRRGGFRAPDGTRWFVARRL